MSDLSYVFSKMISIKRLTILYSFKVLNEHFKKYRTSLLCLPLLLAIGCSSDSPPSDNPKFIGSVTISSNPNSSVPLAAIVEFKSDQPVVASYTVTDGVKTWQAHTHRSGLTGAAVKNSYQTKTIEGLLKFKPNTQHQVNVKITNALGHSTEYKKKLEFITQPLQFELGFPIVAAVNKTEIKKVKESNKQSNDGVILFSVLKKANDSEKTFDSTFGLITAVDSGGDVIWYYQTDRKYESFDVLKSGNLRLISSQGITLEIDMLGNVQQVWKGSQSRSDSTYLSRLSGKVTELSANRLHHGTITLKNGNLLALSTEMRLINIGSRSERWVVGDVVFELDALGNTVDQWPLIDLLDADRSVTSGSLTQISDYYRGIDDKPLSDISHATGLAFDESTETIIVSLRNQSSVIGIDKASGALAWILSDPSTWRDPWRKKVLNPSAKSKFAIVWPVLPGSISLSARGDLLVFEHSLGTASQSQVITYAIDSQDKSVKQVAQVGQIQGQTFYTPYAGGLDMLPDSDGFLLLYEQSLNSKSASESNALLNFNGSVISKIKPDTSKERTQSQQGIQIQVGVSENQWVVTDIAHAVRLIPPVLMSMKHLVAKNAVPTIVEKPKPASINIEQQMRERVVRTTGEPAAIDGDWVLETDTPEGIQSQPLVIDKQQGPLALGTLNDYPLMLAIKGEQMTFTSRVSSSIGRITFKYMGSIAPSGLEALGTFSVLNDKKEILAEGVPWRAVKK